MNSEELLRDDRSDSFKQFGDITKLIAEEHCDVPIDDTTHERWRDLLGLLREFDTLVDDTTIGQDKAMVQLDSFEAFKENYPSLSKEKLPESNRKRLLGRTALILELGDRLVQTKDLDEFIKLRLHEASETTNLLTDSATDETLSNPRFTEVFIPVMRSLGTSSCLLDSIIDGRQDFKAGKISIKPDFRYYKALTEEAALHYRLGTRALIHRSIIRQFGTIVRTRISNRLENGMQPYSTLRNIQ